MNNIDIFLHLYFFKIEKVLIEKTEEISRIKFQSEEANTDEEIKKFLKKIISKYNSIDDIEFTSVIFKYRKLCKDGSNGEEIKNYPISNFKNYSINKVFLPSELTEFHKQEILTSKKSVYTNPDLYLEIIDNHKELKYASIELKSTKTDKIPGSSVQQVNPYEWVIFILHNDVKIDLATGQYINSVTNRLPFPDRSPRPEISFKNLKEWNNNKRTIGGGNSIIFDYNDSNDKLNILSNWNQYLVDEWIDIVKSDKYKKNEKWFNNTLRMFASQLIEYISTIGKEESIKLKKQLDKIIAEINKK